MFIVYLLVRDAIPSARVQRLYEISQRLEVINTESASLLDGSSVPRLDSSRTFVMIRHFMKHEDFVDARRFIGADVRREIQLAQVNDRGQLGSTLVPGGGNLLVALGLLCYTEFGGRLRFDYRTSKGRPRSRDNFDAFLRLLGPAYSAFAANHEVYDIFRCGLAHEYYVKRNCTIYMLAGRYPEGIGVEPSGKFYFIVETYFLALMKALDALELHLFPTIPSGSPSQW